MQWELQLVPRWGGVIGSYVGVSVGAGLGAIGGTLILPGGGTVVVGIESAIVGGTIGSYLGAVMGAVIGNRIEEMISVLGGGYCHLSIVEPIPRGPKNPPSQNPDPGSGQGGSGGKQPPPPENLGGGGTDSWVPGGGDSPPIFGGF